MMKLSFQNKSKLTIAAVTMLLALVLLATGTYAWFTLSLSGNVNTMELKATAGESLRIDVENKGTNIDDWTKSEVDTADIETQLGHGLSTYDISPVTSGNGTDFYRQSGASVEVSAKEYLQFDLWFIASKAMDVYLTEDDSSSGADDGTLVSSKSTNSVAQADIADCVRISFKDSSAVIYEPNKSGSTTLTVSQAGSGTQSTFTDAATSNGSSKVFSLSAGTPKKITVTVWIEGDDAQCDDNVKGAAFLTRLRFEGV